MQNLVYRLDHDKFKSLLVTGGFVHLSSKRFDTPVEFLDALSKKGLLESQRSIPVAGITQMSMLPSDDTLRLHWLDEAGKEKDLSVEFATEADARTVAEGVAAMRGMGHTQRGAGWWTAVKTPLIGFLIAAALSSATYAAAVEIANGGEVEAHGRRAWLKLLIAEAARVLGPSGTVLVGGALCLALLFWTFRRWKSPPMEHLWR